MKTPAIIRGSDQLSLFRMPEHGTVLRDTDGRWWTIKCEGGFKLRDGLECHPEFAGGPKSAVAFAEWFNAEFK